MKKTFFKFGMAAMMMAFALTFCYSCSKDEDDDDNNNVDTETIEGRTIDFRYYFRIVGPSTSASWTFSQSQTISTSGSLDTIYVGDTLSVLISQNLRNLNVSFYPEDAFEKVGIDRLVAVNPTGGQGKAKPYITVSASFLYDHRLLNASHEFTIDEIKEREQ